MKASPRKRDRPLRLFFICTGNSARSQIAEGLAHRLGAGRIEAWSAGTMPVGVNSHAIAVMQERGIDISHQYSKPIYEVPGPFDLVITLCDHAAAICPLPLREFPMEHWSTPDPTFAPGGPEAVHQAFREVRDRLEGQIRDLLDRLLGKGAGDREEAGPKAPVRGRSSRR